MLCELVAVGQCQCRLVLADAVQLLLPADLLTCAPSHLDPMQVQNICRLVLRRSARLAASLLVSVLRLQDWLSEPHRLVVAVDGGVFLKCTSWRKLLTEHLSEAFGE
jgi:hexokinase